MRFILITLIVITSNVSLVFSQDKINQFDNQEKRHGVWKKNYDNSEQLRYEGEFNHGKEIGVFKFYCEDCGTTPSMTKSFNKTNDISEVKYFSKKGKLISEGKMEGKFRIGEWVYFHSGTNHIMTREHYTKGVLNGLKVIYYKNNSMAEEITFNNGIKEGPNNYYAPTGKLLKELIYVNDELHGPAIYYDAEGNIVLEGNYKKGRKHGVWKKYESGKLITEETFPKNN